MCVSDSIAHASQEEQDLSELVDMTNSFSQAAGVEPVQIVIKSPLLAMRYPKGNDRVSRDLIPSLPYCTHPKEDVPGREIFVLSVLI